MSEQNQKNGTDPVIAPYKTFNLSDGRKVEMPEKPKGKHAIKATDMMGGKASMYLPALMCQLCKVEGEFQPMEFYAELDLDDYNLISGEVTGSEKKQSTSATES